MAVLIKILQFLVSFSILVLVHEFGHFIFGRIFGVRVDKFKIFFGKSIVSFTKGDTEYAIGWIPFGGYCKLNGMVDESMDTDFLSQEPQSYEFRSKPAWQRLLIMIGGVMMNVLLAFFIYVGMSMAWGDAYVSTKDMTYGYVFSDEAKRLGFEDGDIILSVNGKEIEDFSKLATTLIIEQRNNVLLVRNGDTLELVTPEISMSNLESGGDFISPRVPFIISDVVPGGGADEVGIEGGDRLVSFEGKPMMLFDEYVAEFDNNRGEVAQIGIERDSAGFVLTKIFPVRISEEGHIGVMVDRYASLTIHVQKYNFWQAFPAGFRRTGSEISGYWKQLKLIFQPKTEAYKSLGGPIAIGGIFPSTWDWFRFWNITALLSIVLAIMNLIPIPGLDGGHVLFLLFEMITGKKPGDKFIMYAQMVGMFILLALMIFVTFNDIHRLFIK